jgi:heat-inducible transcriptional repressor
MNLDAEQLPELTRRQEEILSLIVRSYTQNPEPVSSKYLAETNALSVSSATIRNEMAVLEDLGYIKAPHKSAGRVPTEAGYRYFVRRLISTSALSPAEEQHIAERFRALPVALEQWMRHAATVLARTTQSASLVTPPRADTNQFKHLELVSIQGRLVLMVLVLKGGLVQQRMLNLREPIPQARLSEVATHINSLLLDLNPNQIRLKGLQLPLLEREMVELITEIMERADSQPVRMIYRDGLSEIIGNFHDGEGAQQAIRIYEERAFLDLILAELPDAQHNDIRVIVAGDGQWDELNQISMVLGRYGIPGQISGALGVVGPTHINYGRAISSVRYVSSVMTDLISDLFRNSAAPGDDDLDSGLET